MQNNKNFTSRQWLILSLLSVVILGLITLIVVTVIDQQKRAEELARLRAAVVTMVPHKTRTPLPPPTLRPSITPYPTMSQMPTIRIPTRPTATPAPTQPVAVNILPNSPQNPPASSVCDSATMQYERDWHKYYLALIESQYGPLINYYQSLIDEAVLNRDAYAIDQYASKLKALQNENSADINAENARYKASVPKECR